MTYTVTASSLPPEVERLLIGVCADGFTVYCCGRKEAPTALVAAYEWPRYVDLVTIRAFDRIVAARAPKHGQFDVFAPHISRAEQRPMTIRLPSPGRTEARARRLLSCDDGE